MPSYFIIDDVQCDGSENSLFDCSHTTKENCGPTEGAGAVCLNISANNTVTSPDFPAPYPEDVHECWVQAPSPGQSVILVFTDFDVSRQIDVFRNLTFSPSS